MPLIVFKYIKWLYFYFSDSEIACDESKLYFTYPYACSLSSSL